MNSPHEFLGRLVLGEITERAGPQDVDRILFLGKATHHEKASIWGARPNMPKDIDATAIRHIDVEDDKVPLTVAQLLQRFLTAARLRNRVNRTVLLQIMPEPGPQHRVIIRNKYAWHSTSSRRGRQVRMLAIRGGSQYRLASGL